MIKLLVDISLDLLEVSASVYIPITRKIVDGVKDSIKTRFEPSLLRMTVVPKDPKTFKWANRENES